MDASFSALSGGMPLPMMCHEPVVVSRCTWQTRLQRRGSPLQDCIEYRMLSLLTPLRPAVAVVIHQFGCRTIMEKLFRRREVLEQGDLIGLRLTFPSWDAPWLRLEPATEESWNREVTAPGSHWRPATSEERPRRIEVFLGEIMTVDTGTAIEVASTGPSHGMAMLLVDLEDVKGLRAGRWRLRRRSDMATRAWQILTTGARTVHMKRVQE